MAVCMFWLLTYVGQGLDLAVGNRPVIIVQGAQDQDYRHGNSIRKKSELNAIDGNLLHLRIYPSEGSHRDDLSNWLLLNEEPRISSWTPAGILIDDIIREPRQLQTVFFALSPAMLNVLYSEYVTSQGEPFAHDELNHNLGQHHQRAKKLRIDCKQSRGTVSLPILVCDETGRKTLQESRQSNYDDLFEQRLSTATNPKTDLTRAENSRDYQNGLVIGGGGGGGGGSGGVGGGGGGGGGSIGGASGGFVSKPSLYETNKLPGKRSQISIGRRSIDLPGESVVHQAQIPSVSSSSLAGTSVASQLMHRSTRGSLQYDVPQIECPVSEDGMERFACPTADRMGRYHCIDDHVLCDGFVDCPRGEDEDRQACMFYKTTKAHLDVLADAILRWARGR